VKVSFDHLQINVSDPAISFPFYKKFLGYLGYKVIHESKECVGFSNGTTDFWINKVEDRFKDEKFHRKHPGLNHLAFWVNSKEDVDRFYEEFLKSNGLLTLYETPKYFKEYAPDYYAVFFEDPDRIKLEVVHLSK